MNNIRSKNNDDSENEEPSDFDYEVKSEDESEYEAPKERVNIGVRNRIGVGKKQSQSKSQRKSRSQTKSQRSNKSQSHSQSQRYSQRHDSDSGDTFEKVTFSNDEMTMYSWLSKSTAASAMKEKLKEYFNMDDETDDEIETFHAIKLINYMLLCAGMRTFKLNDTQYIEIKTLNTREKKSLRKKLEYAINVSIVMLYTIYINVTINI